MRFDIGDWLSSHHAFYNLSNSGMYGVVDLKKYFKNYDAVQESAFINDIAALHGIDEKRIVVTHGATEALSLVLFHLRHLKSFNVRLPEYEPIYKVPLMLGYDHGDALNLYSMLNNPTGSMPEIKNRNNIIDETFLEFDRELSFSMKYDGYIINTFTKVFGGDDLRLGYIICPDKENANQINGYKGLLTEPVSNINTSIGHYILKDHDSIVDYVRGIVEENNKILFKNMGHLKFYNDIKPLRSPVAFIDYSYYLNDDSMDFSERLYRAGFTLVPADFFGLKGTYLRLCMTRPNFQESFSKFMEFLEKN
ncbi:aminotransferase class I/II-fold pyridoxal phosphate-dependent enzyme [Picrophilus oshimae]|uniref:Aminotransferase class I and II n=1 Tax=Picrophilus torridus (strain ATCC 700027 / DSM 9790 / JCM 10055 / NBRC 100828 / KAW 2/3) TaxID=1122961 RepID=A0A8G2FXL0_PICTO|nr:aminotransferase class I/II-fold pyridoxal phosphate-dependent enzyme [Picrophilus oshimae]SMD31293.1 Aminotransferase class I and II [Picrophilus oshimae DSM 9789]